MSVIISSNASLAEYTSFQVGGTAEKLAIVSNTKELLEVLHQEDWSRVWLLGYGSNTLISDQGLPGLTIVMRGGTIECIDNTIIADAGVWWDDVVKAAIDNNLWGIELMSEIPGSVGAATYINITAYGQSIGPRIRWVEVWDEQQQEITKYEKDSLEWSYKTSVFQQENHKDEVILRVCIELDQSASDEVVYQKAIDVAEELKADLTTLIGRRKVIIEARNRAGSLWSPTDASSRTAGSFFRNVLVDQATALQIAAFDESHKTSEQIMKMNEVHGGDKTRVSAAHVMLAAGFKRGQIFGGRVMLHEKNLLKIEALDGATAHDIHTAITTIQRIVKDKLGIDLEAEVQLLGDF